MSNWEFAQGLGSARWEQQLADKKGRFPCDASRRTGPAAEPAPARGFGTARHGSPPAGSRREDGHFACPRGTPTSSLIRQGLVVGTFNSAWPLARLHNRQISPPTPLR